MTNVLSMLLGAALVAIGVLAAALADRLRWIRPAGRESTPASAPAKSASAARKVSDKADAELAGPAADYVLRANVRIPVVKVDNEIAAQVVAALAASGYRKADASAAVKACSLSDQRDAATWLKSALRHIRGS